MAAKEKGVKCVVWDLDNTLWDGTLLESDDVRLRPQIPEILKTLDERGILHSIASRNSHDYAMSKLEELGVDEYFLYPQINWNAKSESVATIRERLNLGMNTFIFVDDQEFEREEVGTAHPEVRCWDAASYLDLLTYPSCIPRFITDDSKRRRQMYLDEMGRQEKEKEFVGPKEEFLASLNMRFVIAPAREEDLKRAEDLTVRTNQLNATGVTYSHDELDGYRKSPDHKLLICELTDRFGSYGKIGLALVGTFEEHWHLHLLLVSCRVMSRGLGTFLLTYLLSEAKRHGKKRLLADFVKTDRNRMMYVGYRFANFKELSSEPDGRIVMENDLSMIQDFPPYVDLVVLDE